MHHSVGAVHFELEPIGQLGIGRLAPLPQEKT